MPGALDCAFAMISTANRTTIFADNKRQRKRQARSLTFIAGGDALSSSDATAKACRLYRAVRLQEQ